MNGNGAGKFSNFPTNGGVRHTVIDLGSIRTDPESKSTKAPNELHSPSLLPGERKPYVNSLSPRQMEVLTAFSDTLLPSVFPDINCSGQLEDSLFKFYRTSASMAGTPELVGGFLSGKIEHPMLGVLLLALWLLSTWFGTFILCGIPSLSTQFPYFQRFSQVSQKKREKILLSWSSSSFNIYRMLFKTLKYLVFFIFFTQVDENNENPTWRGIDYCGPDPDFINNRTRETKTPQGHEHEELFEPLYRGIVNMRQPREALAETLRQSGFHVRLHPHRRYNPSPSHPSLTIRCDAVVVGSGSGGGVAAGILAKAGYKVAVLEKGNYFGRKNLSLLEGPSMDEMYLSGGLMVTDDMGVIMLAGSTVGGGSTINWSASIRTPQHVIREWCNEYELELFGSKLYKEAMDVVCKRMGVQPDVEEESLSNTVLRKGCSELGYPVITAPRNSPPNHYCGWCCFGCKDGRKKGTSETWLVDLVDSGNGVILPGCEALKILHERKKGRKRNTATGVVFEFNNGWGKDFCVLESKVTIVAGGALCTPTLLKRSGLRNSNIGKNLHLHPVVMAWGHFPSRPADSGWPEKDKKSYKGGIITAMSTVVANSEGSGYGAVIQTPMLHPGMFSVITPWISSVDMRERMSKFSRTAYIFALARDKGSGQVNSPSSISYRMDAMDEEHLKQGLEKILRILAAAGAEEIGTSHCLGRKVNVKKVSSNEFERFVKKESRRALRDLRTPIPSAHQMGSCRMGVDPKSSVVNHRGETWEVEGLFLADSSVFPTALGVNPMVTIQSIAYCTAQSVLEVLRRKKDDLISFQF
ncbi:PREDICTED: long-chain-alcohol oxidase FAO4A-like [Nelumbo nucifera]|uniref:long-chain-alcohol oxidase n=1 Tax=Nelumbo nucifera TaxID=4432 RepID=A0A1U8B338_NELNU|nr:PREDICTED: long-chain-alcohol oxidase FAO4A-like [Nelumbo nucifera]